MDVRARRRRRLHGPIYDARVTKPEEREPRGLWWLVKTLFAWFGLLSLISIIAIVGFTFASISAPPRVLQTCTQPDSIVYTKSQTYKVFRSSTGWPWLAEGYDANVGLDSSYGVGIDLNPAGKDNDIDCKWSDDGVTTVEFGGISHFVPKAVFIGGR